MDSIIWEVVVRVGTDLVEVARLERLLGTVGEAFINRTWTPAELSYCAGRAESLAARWAAKEAAMKALGMGIGEVAMTDIEVLAGPVIALHGGARQAADALGLNEWAVSLTHDGGFALAFVVAAAS